jgi:hypothetical protein
MEKEMKVVVQGTNEFDEYSVFLRSMGVMMSGLKETDHEFIVYSLGPSNVNDFASEFCNVSERNLKARGIKVKFIKVHYTWVEENLHEIDYFSYLSKPNQALSNVAKLAQAQDFPDKFNLYQKLLFLIQNDPKSLYRGCVSVIETIAI